jgi:hypothetical protein
MNDDELPARGRCRALLPLRIALLSSLQVQTNGARAMSLNRKIAFLFALIVAFVGVVPLAVAQYYDPRDRGYNDDYGRYDSRVRCESRDSRTNYCNVDTRGGVRLVHQLSDRDCVRGRNWGANERGIWVTDGCRAEFELGAGGNGYGNGNGYASRFRCESSNSRTRYCQVDTRYGVELVRQLSNSACIEGRSWGVNRDGVWVSRGCRAEFALGGSDFGYRDETSYRRY